MTPDEGRLAAQSALYDEVLESPITSHVLDYLYRTRMLLRIADGDYDTVHSVLYTDAGRQAAGREYEQLSDDERQEAHEAVAEFWSLNVNLAVRKLWHAAEVLELKRDTLDVKLVAMTAATYFSMPADDLIDELKAMSS